MKLLTEIHLRPCKFEITAGDRITLLGSCFSDNMGLKLRDGGFSVLSNPFGTIYNPESIATAIRRLDSQEPYGPHDCVEMGAGAGLICSFEHHTSFARRTAEEFLENANRSLDESRAFWKESNKVIITLGTAGVWRREGRTVSNCLKRPGYEFTREMLGLGEVSELLEDMVVRHPGKDFIFTVSPVRYLSSDPQGNSISKALLHLGMQRALNHPSADYFPAYEIVTDELRDYRFYAADLLHPRDIATDHVWAKFLEFCVPLSGRKAVAEAEKEALRSKHRSFR